MKHLYLLFSVALVFMACSKDKDKFDPTKPKNGQVVELFVDHYSTGSDSRIFLNTDRNESLHTSVDNFSARELGYTYVIKAKVVVAPEGLMDAPPYWFDYIETIRKEQYQGQDTIMLPLFGDVGPFGTFFLGKEAAQYYYRSGYNGAQLVPFNSTVKADLDTALVKWRVLVAQPTRPKPGALYVKHDPDNYSKGYLVYRVVLQ